MHAEAPIPLGSCRRMAAYLLRLLLPRFVSVASPLPLVFGLLSQADLRRCRAC